jgi:hypothetical protein
VLRRRETTHNGETVKCCVRHAIGSCCGCTQIRPFTFDHVGRQRRIPGRAAARPMRQEARMIIFSIVTRTRSRMDRPFPRTGAFPDSDRLRPDIGVLDADLGRIYC